MLWGWRGRLASPQSSSVASPRPSLRPSLAETATRKRPFAEVYRAVRKSMSNQQEYGSVSDLLKDIGSDKAKRARPTIGEKMPRWGRRFQWPKRSYGKSKNAASRGGGGIDGYVATKDALNDIYQVL